MNEPISDELLSAYFDDELPIQERAEIEAWLAENPDGKLALADYRRMSRLFDEMPRGEVSAEFADEVLQQAERQMLLPETSPRLRYKQLRRGWLAIPAAAAAVLIFTFILAQSGNNSSDDVTKNSPQASKNSQENSEPARHDFPALNDELIASNGTRAVDSVNPDDPLVAKNNLTETVSSEVLKMESEVERAFKAADLRQEKVGDENDGRELRRYIPVLLIRADQTSDLALDVLFEKSSINRVQTESENVEEKPREPAEQRAYLVVLNNSDQLQMFDSFGAMIKNRHGDLHFEAQEPILLSDLDEKSKEQLDRVEHDIAENDSRLNESATASQYSPTGAEPNGEHIDSTSENHVADTIPKPRPKQFQYLHAIKKARKSTIEKSRLEARETNNSVETLWNARTPVPNLPPLKEEELPKADTPVAKQILVPIPPGYRPLPLSSGEPPRHTTVTESSENANPDVRSGDGTSEPSVDADSIDQGSITILILVKPN